ncbi:hypothetical protein KCU77_g8053, partial [Aureobasidium melanogenum]
MYSRQQDNKDDNRPLPDQTSAVAPELSFTFPVVPLHKMARLNASLEAVNGNTHVGMLQKWRRERGLKVEAIAELTRGEGEAEPKAPPEVSVAEEN